MFDQRSSSAFFCLFFSVILAVGGFDLEKYDSVIQELRAWKQQEKIPVLQNEGSR